MAHLAHRIYRPRPPHHILFDGAVVEAAVSPVHLVFMHGLFGNNRNFSSLCTSMAGLDPDARLLAEGKIGLAAVKAITVPDLSTAAVVPRAAAPRLYTSTAFDWRNHGDSAHNPDMSLDGLAEDLASYLELYATRLRYEQLQAGKHTKGIECEPIEGAPLVLPPTDPLASVQSAEKMLTPPAAAKCSSPKVAAAVLAGMQINPPTRPLPLMLVAHSMGAMGLMHWMWREHVNIWAHTIFLGDDSPLIANNVFRNDKYEIVGAVIIDMAPSQRPASFNDTIRMIDFLPEAPLHKLRTPQEVEKWLMANGPKDVYNQHNLFQIRHHLCNIDYSDPSSPRWKIGLQEIIGGLHEILWEAGGIASMQQARDALMVANKRRIAEHKCIWERPQTFASFPTYFIFGGESPYNTPLAHQGVCTHFHRPHLAQVEKADHFMFMRHRSTFMSLLRDYCYDAERQANIT